MKNQREKGLTYEQLLQTADYINKRMNILKEINNQPVLIDRDSFKKTKEEKKELWLAKKAWKGNDKDFFKEFMNSSQIPNFGSFKFNKIALN